MAAQALLLFQRVCQLKQLLWLLLMAGQVINVLLLLLLTGHHAVEVVHQLRAVGVERDVGGVGEGGAQSQCGRRLRGGRPHVQVVLAVIGGRQAVLRLVDEILRQLKKKTVFKIFICEARLRRITRRRDSSPCLCMQSLEYFRCACTFLRIFCQYAFRRFLHIVSYVMKKSITYLRSR